MLREENEFDIIVYHHRLQANIMHLSDCIIIDYYFDSPSFERNGQSLAGSSLLNMRI